MSNTYSQNSYDSNRSGGSGHQNEVLQIEVGHVVFKSNGDPLEVLPSK